MNRAISQFKNNVQRVRALGGLFDAIDGLTTSAVDATDLLRAQMVMSVSALDHYVHEVTLLGMLEVFDGTRPVTPAFLRFQVPMSSTIAAVGAKSHAWLEDTIRERHSYLSFQYPDRIADAIRLFSPCELWSCVASAMGSTPTDVKSRLRLIVDRRNKIVHEADLDPSYPSVRWPISKPVVKGVIDYIQMLCNQIHVCVV